MYKDSDKVSNRDQDLVRDHEPAVERPPRIPAPVSGEERIVNLDLLRGFAVLGILLVNMWSYGLMFPAAVNPRFGGFDQGLDRIAYLLVYFLAWVKTMPIFSMLFGAGIVVFTNRVEARGGKIRGLFYRRMLWMVLIGLAHGYLLWSGDILVPYAFCGMIMYLFRKRRPRTLVIIALCVLLIPKAGLLVGKPFFEKIGAECIEAEAAHALGDSLTSRQETMVDVWGQIQRQWNPSEEEVVEIAKVMHGDYLTILKHHAPELLTMHVAAYPLAIAWNLYGYMLLGMALFKAGILTGERSAVFYARMAAMAYGVGIPLSVFVLRDLYLHYDRFDRILVSVIPLMDIAGSVVALGHIALLSLIARRGWLAAMRRRLCAVGRMALTNYLSHTVICVLLFNGYGLGLFGSLSRLQLLGVTLVVWALQLAWSTWWLERFRFGPAEWLWRSLTYRSRQGMRVVPTK